MEHSNTISAQTQNPSFLSSTFGFFALALLVTVLGSYLGMMLMFNLPTLFQNPFVFYGAIIGELILAFTAQSWSRNLPFGYGMFAMFSLLSGFTLVPILVVAGVAGGTTLIIKALFSSISVFAAAGLYGWTTHRNLQGMGGFLSLALIGIIIMGILHIFFPWSNTMEMVISAGTVLLFSGYTMFEIQRLKSDQLMNPMVAAIGLYLSFINIFVSILRFMIALGNRN